MANIFSQDNLTNSASFDFSKVLNQQSTSDENNYFINDSPYNCAEISCQYVSEPEFIAKYANHLNPSVLSLNIQSLAAKFSEFSTFINSLAIGNCAPDVICLQEIWRIPDNTMFSLNGYHPLEFKSRRNNVQGGGVGIYVRSDLNYTLNNEMSVFHDRIFETIFVTVTFGSKKFNVGSVYRPGTPHPQFSQNEQFSQFLELFSSLSDCCNSKKAPAYIFGDINLDCLKYGLNTHVTDYIDLLFSHGMLQVILKPTRVTLNSATLIDHVITNSGSNTFDTTLIISKLSDHFPIVHFISHRKTTIKQKTVSARVYSDTNISKFNELLSSLSWNDVLTNIDPQIAYNKFSDTLFGLLDIGIPLSSKKFNKNFHKIESWMTVGLLVSRRTKIGLEKINFKNPSAESLQTLKNFRNLYNKVLRAAKKKYFENELRLNQSNAKKSWELIRSAMNKKNVKSSTISHIVINNSVVSDPQEMANHFNSFFTSVSSVIVNEINPTDHPPDLDFDANSPPLFSFTENPITEKELIEATHQLQNKKTLDMDGISVWLIQKIILSIKVPLLHIFSFSLSSGVVPQQLKVAKVIPVFKSGEKDSMDNYRPISLLCSFSKIIEKIVCARLSNFLEFNNLFSNSQYGFRKKHSTIHPLVHFLNFVSSSLDKKEHCIAIFCDLRKAFDCVDHGILINKMKKMGIGGRELLWFQNYLANRKQIVHINGSNSLLLNILIGVPQGSILGPLLFLIYINDLPICSELIALLFADDTTLLLTDSCIDSLIQRVNTELKKVTDFFRSHKLALHPAKTKYILFTNSNEVRSRNIQIFLNFNNNSVVSPDVNLVNPLTRVTVNSDVPAIKFLGIFIDPLLSFKYHINTLVSKISKSLYFLRAVQNVLTPQALKSVYYAIIHSHLIYGIHIWSCTAPSNLQSLVTKQKAAIRYINNAKYNAHTETLFKNSKILPLPSLINYFKLQFMHRFTINVLPKSFEFTWTRNLERRTNNDQPSLRNEQDIFIPYTRLSSTDLFPLSNFPRLWTNFADAEIKNLTSVPLFNSKLKEHFIQSLSSSYTCSRLLCPHCHLQT